MKTYVTNNCWCVIPVFNNAQTIEQVATDCSQYTKNLLIIDDGSTDANLVDLFADTDFTIISHEVNLGKGQALKTALDFLHKKDVEHMITIDGDGQHYASDIPKFIEASQDNKDAIIIGCRDFEVDNVPDKSKFGRSFSNMWLRIEAGIHCTDTQSGFRSYPVKHIHTLVMNGSHYDFEVEVLARAAWAGIQIKDVQIDVYYPPAEQRISSFKPFADNVRISWMHTKLVTRRLLPLPHKRLIELPKEKIDFSLFKDPRKFFMYLLKDNATPMGLAASAALGTFLAVVPLIACHTVAIIYASTRLHLNKALAVAIQNLYVPPLSPAICIYVGFYMRMGQTMVLHDMTFESVKKNIHLHLLDWLLGSLIVAPLFSVIAAFVVYNISKRILAENGQ